MKAEMSYKISVALATYNGAKYLKDQLDSIYAQTRVPDEVVVVDDKSTDETSLVLEEYRVTKGLKYVINERNLGVNGNFEKAIKLCSGDYVCISDQDDYWFSTKIEKSIKKLIEIEKDYDGPIVVTSRAINADENLHELPTVLPSDDSEGPCDSIFNYLSQGSAIIMNRCAINALLPFPKNELLYDDYIGTAIACIGRKYNLAEPLMYYRIHDNNVHARKSASEKISFKHRVLTKLSKAKYNTVMPSQRYLAIEYVKNRFHDQFSYDARVIVDALLTYKYGNLYEKLRSLKTIEKNKISYYKLALITILMYNLPIDEVDKYKLPI